MGRVSSSSVPAFSIFDKPRDDTNELTDNQVKKLLKAMLDDESIARARISKQLNMLADEKSARECP